MGTLFVALASRRQEPQRDAESGDGGGTGMAGAREINCAAPREICYSRA
jgi:hypothetical protein